MGYEHVGVEVAVFLLQPQFEELIVTCCCCSIVDECEAITDLGIARTAYPAAAS